MRKLRPLIGKWFNTSELNALWKPEKRGPWHAERFTEANRLLLDMGLDLNVLRPENRTQRSTPLTTYAPLHLVALTNWHARMPVMLQLLELGADPHLKDHAGREAEQLLVDVSAPDEDVEAWASAARSWRARQSALDAIAAMAKLDDPQVQPEQGSPSP